MSLHADLFSCAAPAALFPPVPVIAAPQHLTMEDVRQHIALHGPAYLLQALRTLETHLGTTSLADMAGSEAAVLKRFPKSKRGMHPRPDLGQTLAAYKKWLADLLRAIGIADGARAARAERAARRDAWAAIIAAVKTHAVESDVIPSGSLGPLQRLADLGRQQGFEPWELADPALPAKIEAGVVHSEHRDVVRRAMMKLAGLRFLPEIAALLPPAEKALAVPPSMRDLSRLPDHVDAVIRELVDKATLSEDSTNGKTRRTVAQTTVGFYLAAMRYHVRTLRRCTPEPGYSPPNIDSVNDVVGLYDPDHIGATIRWTEAHDHLPDTIEAGTAHDYYEAIKRILALAGVLPEGLGDKIGGSHFLKLGGAVQKGMTPKMQSWCEALLKDPAKTAAFFGMHITLMSQAAELLAAARREGRAPKHLRDASKPADASLSDLSSRELTRIRALGVAAAASAIEISGRPIRKGNVLGLRLDGSHQNFFLPTKTTRTYGFLLAKEETKSRSAEPRTELSPEQGGTEILDWYLKVVRPLFPHHGDSIHLFPSVETRRAALDPRTFDIWFQGACARTSLPMTFHRWRHGFATFLLDESPENLGIAAAMLGNTPAVCAKYYGWLNKQKIVAIGQKIILRRSRKL